MRYRKTSSEKRETYRQLDENGRCVYEFIPSTAEEKELVINMHRLDDSEVRVNCKERWLPPDLEERRKKEAEQYVIEFEKRYGQKPYPGECPIKLHRTYFYIDSLDKKDEGADEGLGDSSWIEKEMAVNPFEEESSAVKCMRELVETFTDREKQVYYYVFRRGETQYQASIELGISEVRVGQIVKNIKKKLQSNKELRRYFRIPEE